MKVFSHMQTDNYEQVVFCQDKHAKLKAIIVIHDTTLGPALGGLRIWPYKSDEEALEDALRLARGMTYKNSAAGVNLGGGKAVVIGDPATDKSEELFRAFGRYVESLNGRYITAVDVGSTVQDMNIIHQETDHVIGTTKTGASGNPAPVTANGIYKGIKATAQEAFGSDSLVEKTIAVQGVGNVAFRLCEYLHKEGANLIVTDIDGAAVERAVEKFSAKAVAPDDIYDVDCDIFSPCALGAIINDDTIPRLKAKAIAGSANNQLAESKHGDMLYKKGIVYAPDFVINAGGVINVADELEPNGYDQQRAMEKVEQIYHNLERVFAISKRDQIPTYLAADRMAEERIQSIQQSRNQFLMKEHHALSRRQ